MSIINIYNEIIDKLMSNDGNAIWDEILPDMEERYVGEDIIKYSIVELIEALETALEDCDDDVKEFYNTQYLKAKELVI